MRGNPLRNLVLASLAALLASPAVADDLESLRFLVGSWRSTTENAASEEHWLAPAGGIMLGVHRTVRGEGAFYEYLRIEKGEDGTLTYVASPMGRPGTPFRLVELGENRVLFQADREDFPQRIGYSVEADGSLRARAEGIARGKLRVEEWRWERTRTLEP